ncbi:transposase [Nocardia sp. NPDC056541]|uniref:transposase n=1 Tax=Nocardia sp. NPDC056541 TaxID=3345860 RepID=UPI00366A73C2
MARRHSPEQIIRNLREGEKLIGQSFSIEEVCKHLEISEASWHRWRAKYGGNEVRRRETAQGARAGKRAAEGAGRRASPLDIGNF